MVNAPNAHAAGTDARASSRPRSVRIIVRRLDIRSAITPANGLNTKNGKNLSAASTPASNAPPCSTTTATVGSATREILSPKLLMVWPNQSRRKSG